MTTQYDYGRRGSGTFYSLVLVLLIGAAYFIWTHWKNRVKLATD